jgi:hypothetical protein
VADAEFCKRRTFGSMSSRLEPTNGRTRQQLKKRRRRAYFIYAKHVTTVVRCLYPATDKRKSRLIGGFAEISLGRRVKADFPFFSSSGKLSNQIVRNTATESISLGDNELNSFSKEIGQRLPRKKLILEIYHKLTCRLPWLVSYPHLAKTQLIQNVEKVRK